MKGDRLFNNNIMEIIHYNIYKRYYNFKQGFFLQIRQGPSHQKAGIILSGHLGIGIGSLGFIFGSI